MVKLPPKSTEVASGVIQAPQTINRPRYIRRFLADERNLWGHLKKIPEHGIQCAQLLEPIEFNQPSFQYMLTRPSKTGTVYFMIPQPIIYPGKKSIYIEVQYLTPDGKLHVDIIVLKTVIEPRQDQVDCVYQNILSMLTTSKGAVCTNSSWNAGYLLPDYTSLLRDVLAARGVKRNANHIITVKKYNHEPSDK